MSNHEQPKYKREMRGYAELYAMIFQASSRESFIKNNDFLDKTLKGKWLSFTTEAKPFYLNRADGTQLRVLAVTKKGHQNNNCTGLLWLHGGGYAIGLPELEVMYANQFTEDDDCVMILPDYTRSVDAPYPAAIEDAYQTLLWMRDNADSLGIRKDQLFVGGESAGGGLTCALTLYARDRKEVNIAFQMPLFPMLDDRMTETSSHNHAPVWNTKKNLAAWKLYRGDRKETSPYFAPARETEYHDLPPAFSIISDTEPFYAETKIYFQHLYEAGTEVMLKEFHGCFHAFDMTCPNTESARRARRLEQNVFHYAQKQYFAAQTEELPSDPNEDADIDDIVKDIETQQKYLNSQKEQAASVPENAEAASEGPVAVKEEAEEKQEEETSAAVQPEEPAAEETVPEEPVIEESAEEPAEGLDAEPVEESAEEQADVSEDEILPEIEDVQEEIEEVLAHTESVPEVDHIEERPVEEGTAVVFPSQPEEDVISVDEIDAISQRLTEIKPEEAFPEDEDKAEETVSESQEKVEEVKESVQAERFTREDVMKLLQKKEVMRQDDGLKPYHSENESGEEDIMTNLQRIIAQDTNDSLDQIDDLIDKL